MGENTASNFLNEVKAKLCSAIITMEDLSLRQVGEIAAIVGCRVEIKFDPTPPKDTGE